MFKLMILMFKIFDDVDAVVHHLQSVVGRLHAARHRHWHGPHTGAHAAAS